MDERASDQGSQASGYSEDEYDLSEPWINGYMERYYGRPYNEIKKNTGFWRFRNKVYECCRHNGDRLYPNGVPDGMAPWQYAVSIFENNGINVEYHVHEEWTRKRDEKGISEHIVNPVHKCWCLFCEFFNTGGPTAHEKWRAKFRVLANE